MKPQTIYSITGLGFILLSVLTASTNLTAFVIVETPTKTNFLSLILLISGISSLTIGFWENKR